MKETLYDLCASTQHSLLYKGAQKDVNYVKSCFKVLNECGDNVPGFVSHHLEELPPVTFTNMDVCQFPGRWSSTDLSLGSKRGRIPGGAAILWKESLDSLIKVIRPGVDSTCNIA